MDDKKLVQILSEKLEKALNASDGGISQKRRDLFDRYLGAKEGTERPGYSSFTTREVMEAVEWAMPAIMRIFAGGDKYVMFDPVGLEDEAAAEQETDVVNHLVKKANGGGGFLALYSFVKDTLINPTAYAKVFVDEDERHVMRTANSLLDTELQQIEATDGVEIIEQDSHTIEIEVPDETGAIVPQGIEVFDIKYKQVDKRPKLQIIPVPGEEALIDDNFTGMDLDKAQFVAHRTRKTFSDLVKMGYDEEELKAVGPGESGEWNDERTHRLFYEDEQSDDDESEPDESLKPYWVHECWLWVDYDDDGVAEYRKVFMIGNKIFENEETDYQPMVAMCSSIIPHKHTGLSLAEMVEDLQRLLTTLTRRMLDNTYRTNTNRKFFSEDSLLEDGSTMEAMLDPTGEWVPVRGSVRDAVFPEQTTSMLQEILPVIQHVQTSTSMRTGVAPENNVDPGVLQQATYGAFMGAMEKAGERIEMIARIMAETGIKQLFRKTHVLCRVHPDIATTVKLRGKWVETEPFGWQDRTDMTVNVGLGMNDKRQMMEMIVSLLEIQKEAQGMGLATPQHIYNALEKLVEFSAIGKPESYFVSPDDPNYQPPQPQPDPQGDLFRAQAQALGQEQERKKAEFQMLDQAEVEIKQKEVALKEAEFQTLKKAELELKQKELEIKETELRLKEKELQMKADGAITEDTKLEAEIDHIDADADKKKAEAAKTIFEMIQLGEAEEDHEG